LDSKKTKAKALDSKNTKAKALDSKNNFGRKAGILESKALALEIQEFPKK
jgi:hypothetical protein